MSSNRPPEDGEDRPTGAPGDEPRGEPHAEPHDTARVTTPPPKAPLAQRVPMGRLVLGLVLVALGVIWLLEALDVVSFSFLAVLPAALILVGVVLLAGARTGRHSGLIVLGIVLTVILTMASGFDIRLRGGAGERTERPTTLTDVQNEYHLSAGQLTIDLRSVDFSVSQGTRIEASVGLGQLTVRVPTDAGLVVVTAHAGAGQVTLFGRENSGVDVDLSARSLPPGEAAFVPMQPLLTLDLSVGLGQIEVTR